MTRHLTLLLCIAVISSSCGDDRSPRGVAARISGLEMPRNHVVLEHREQWNEFNGDGEGWFVLQFGEAEFATLIAAAREAGYVELLPQDPKFESIRSRSGGVTEGWYRLQTSNAGLSYDLTVLDTNSNRLVIRIVET